MIVALVGQPNCGKSALFNAVAGYRTETGNFPGTTVEGVRSEVFCDGTAIDLVDLPAIYSLSSTSAEERRQVEGLLALRPDVIVNVVDASLLERGLELTGELLELPFPVVVCLNMMDEARRKGISIDVPYLEGELGIPVAPVVATRGEGISNLFRLVLAEARRPSARSRLRLSRDVEEVVGRLTDLAGEDLAAAAGLPRRLLALKLVERDGRVEELAGRLDPDLLAEARQLRDVLEVAHGRPGDVVVASERHALSMNLFEAVARVRRRLGPSRAERADALLLHPVWGAAVLLLVLLAFFHLVFGAGRLVEEPLLGGFDRLEALLGSHLERGTWVRTVVSGLLQGFSGGVAIVLPYLVPFLAGLALLEDVGYLPRVAFLMDGLMHRIGLHGRAVIPLVLGYGCSVPAVMGSRLMESGRDRQVTALLASLIPCAARTTVVFALIGFFLGPLPALGFYLLNLLVVALAGRLLLRLYPEASPGLILEIPPYRLPSAKVVAQKVWFRLREFVVEAWPILIAGSLVLSLIEHLDLSATVNGLLAPLVRDVLGLPPEVGVSLVFGVLRKELTVVMLVQALGTADFASVLTSSQMCVYTAFILFYVPCVATLAAMRSVIGLRGTLLTAVLTTFTAVVVALPFRLVGALLP